MSSQINEQLHLGSMNWLLDLLLLQLWIVWYVYLQDLFVFIFLHIHLWWLYIICIYLLSAANSAQAQGSQLCSALQGSSVTHSSPLQVLLSFRVSSRQKKHVNELVWLVWWFFFLVFTWEAAWAVRCGSVCSLSFFSGLSNSCFLTRG